MSDDGFLNAKKVKKSEELWLMSFSDLSLILISFFILQLSYSSVDKKKYDNVKTNIEKEVKPNEKIPPGQPKNLEELSKWVETEIKKSKLEQYTDVKFDADGLKVEFKDKLLFSPGSAAPNPEYKTTVEKVLRVIARAPDRYKVRIEGHTDDTPLLGGQFKSNWQLSAARGISLLNSFEAIGRKDSRMEVIALAHTQPKVPIAKLSGKSLQDARSANRRVVIRVE